LRRAYNKSIPAEQNEKEGRSFRIDSFASKKTMLIIGVFVVFIGILLFSTSKTDVIAKTSDCWEMFKKENCDLDNPYGSLCKSLHDCYLIQRERMSKKNSS